WQKNENTIVVPKGKYFVLGDHRSVSNDSRYWGFVDKSKVMGVVKAGFWTNKTQQININDQWQTFFAK
ncbi:signal peptidase I, partial [Weissella soli]